MGIFNQISAIVDAMAGFLIRAFHAAENVAIVADEASEDMLAKSRAKDNSSEAVGGDVSSI